MLLLLLLHQQLLRRLLKLLLVVLLLMLVLLLLLEPLLLLLVLQLQLQLQLLLLLLLLALNRSWHPSTVVRVGEFLSIASCRSCRSGALVLGAIMSVRRWSVHHESVRVRSNSRLDSLLLLHRRVLHRLARNCPYRHVCSRRCAYTSERRQLRSNANRTTVQQQRVCGGITRTGASGD
jgi:hypothetical protein